MRRMTTYRRHLGLVFAIILPLCLLAAGCANFVKNAKKIEYSTAVTVDGAMKAWAQYYHAATNNPASFGTTLSQIETNRLQVNALARRVGIGMQTLDLYLAAYQTNSAVEPAIQATVDSLVTTGPAIVSFVQTIINPQFTPPPH